MRKALAALALAAGGLLGAVGLAGAGTVAPLSLVSGPSPFASCTIGGPGTNYVNAEVEPWVDVNPADPANIVGVFQQDRWSNGGAHGLVAGVSHDGGTSWSESWAHFSLCSGGTSANGGDYERTSDPWVSFGPTGTAYQVAISFDQTTFRNGVLVSRSTNGGDTWEEPISLIRDTDGNVFNDKESVTADPANPNLAYAVWDRLVFPTSERANVIAGFVSFAFRGPVWFSRTTDGGSSWEPARQIFDPGQENQTIGNQIVVLPNGTLVDGFDEIHVFQNAKKLRGLSVRVIRSTDHGLTWSSSILVDRLGTIGVTDPETGDPVRTGDIIPEFAVDPANGTLYAVWQDARFSGFQHDSIAFSQSTDSGLTWSAPIMINKTPTSIANGNQQAFTASVHVSADGTVGVTYYDFRSNTSDPTTLPTDYFIVECHGGCTNAANWTEEQITPTSFNMRTAPNAGGFFTGDYEGLATVGIDFLPLFVQANSGNTANRTDAFATRVTP
jgi:hypothetical protein